MKKFEVLASLSHYTTARDNNSDLYYIKTGKGVKLTKEQRDMLTEELYEIGGVYNGTKHAWFFAADPYHAIQAALGRREMPNISAMLDWRNEQLAKRQKCAKAATGEFARQLEKLYDLVAKTIEAIDESRLINNRAIVVMRKDAVKSQLATIAAAQFVVDEEDVNAIVYGIYQKFQKKSAVRAEKDWYAVSLASFKSAVRAYIWDRVNNIKAAEEARKEAAEMAETAVA